MVSQRHRMETHWKHRNTDRHHWSLTLLGMGLIVMFAYYGESVLAVLFFAILLSFMLSPVVQALEYLHIPRAMAALISVVVLLAVLYGVTVASYNQAIIFADNVPKYSQKIRSILQPFQQQAEKIEKTGEAVGEPEPSNVVPVRQVTELVRRAHPRSRHLDRHRAGGVVHPVPGLLSADLAEPCAVRYRDAVSSASPAHGVRDPGADRQDAAELHCGELADRPADLGRERGDFRLLHVPFFYFVGFLSGFLSLVPYLGIVLAMVPPILVGLGQLEAGDLVVVVFCVVGMHLVRAECAVSEAAGQPPEDQSAGGHASRCCSGERSGAQSDWCSPFRSRARSRLSLTTSSR